MTVYTVGYEGRTLDEFIANLVSMAVYSIADVREAPISRKKGFSKSALSTALGQAGITYRHIRALGCPKTIRDAYRLDSDWSRYTVSYLAHLRRQVDALAELATLTEAQSTALLCFEADFNRCHRTYVARAVSNLTGAAVGHITATGFIREVPGSSGAAGRSRSRSAIDPGSDGRSP